MIQFTYMNLTDKTFTITYEVMDIAQQPAGATFTLKDIYGTIQKTKTSGSGITLNSTSMLISFTHTETTIAGRPFTDGPFTITMLDEAGHIIGLGGAGFLSIEGRI